MVSDLLRTPPEPAILPGQTRERIRAASSEPLSRRASAARSVSATAPKKQLQSAEPELQLTAEQLQQLADLSEERERAKVTAWNRRPYGERTDGELALLLSDSLSGARGQDRSAIEASEKAPQLSERLATEQELGQTRGQRYVADAGAAREAAEHLGHLSAADGKGRLALRFVGTSRKEHERLTREARERRAAAWNAESDARIAANRAQTAAWETVRDSPYAGAMDATRHTPPGDIDVLTDQLAAMRRELPVRGQHMDTSDLQTAALTHGQATKAKADAEIFRGITSAVQTEQTLRTRIAEKHPALQSSEQQARAEYQQQRAQQHREQTARNQLSARSPSSRSGGCADRTSA
jgi:hypothetical protein